MIPFVRMLEYGNNILRIKQLRYGDCCYVLYSNGELYGYGLNVSGTLGQGDKVNRYDRFYLIDTNVKVFHSCDRSLVYIKKDLTIWCTGEQTSYSTSTLHNVSPTNITSYFSTIQIANIKKIQTAKTSIVILMNDGLVYGIGNNTSGELGTGNTNAVQSLRLISTNSADISANVGNIGILDTGSNFLISGLNNYGQLGTGNTSSDYTFKVRINNARTIELSLYGSYCELNNGFYMACGYNASGEIGTGSSNSSVLTFSTLNVGGSGSVDLFYNNKISRTFIASASFAVVNSELYSTGNGTATSQNKDNVQIRSYAKAINPLQLSFDGISSGYSATFMHKGLDIYYTGFSTMNLNGTGTVLTFTKLTKGLPY